MKSSIGLPASRSLSAATPAEWTFSVKTYSLMHSSPLPLKTWGLALYLLTTNLKGVSSMKLHRDLGITQKTAWFLAHRIRKAWETDNPGFSGPARLSQAQRSRILERNGIAIWTLAAIATCLTLVYLFTMGLSAETVVETQKVHLIVLAGGLFPCLFAYAFTRVVYGVEVLVEG